MMSLEQRRAYLEEIKKRYKKSNRQGKARILDEFCSVCHYNRKYAIRILKRRVKKRRQHPGQKPKYDSKNLLNHLKAIWFASDQMCSKKLKVVIRDWLPHYEEEQGLLDDLIRGQLYSISPSTIDRILKPIRLQHSRKGLGGTKPGRLLKNQIPIKTDHWDVTQPGYMEADTVAHCGNSLAGDFVWSITLTDIKSTWTALGSNGTANPLKAFLLFLIPTIFLENIYFTIRYSVRVSFYSNDCHALITRHISP